MPFILKIYYFFNFFIEKFYTAAYRDNCKLRRDKMI